LDTVDLLTTGDPSVVIGALASAVVILVVAVALWRRRRPTRLGS
jgi:uncharacterized protein (TIGR03382 family)